MVEATYHFIPGFLWGSATSSHQVEGNNTNNNWSRWEEDPRHIYNGQRSGLACDWWGGRWKEDFNRAAAGGQNAHRLSVEWSRIQPDADRWDEDAIDYYRQIVRGLVERNMTPMVTLHHFTDPLWLGEMGGWENDKSPLLFANFVEKIVDALKEYVTLWVTINEPNVYVYQGYIEGNFPPGKKDPGAAFKVMANMLRGHAAAYRVIHRIQALARVGVAHHNRGFQPANPWMPLDRLVTGQVSSNFNDPFPRALATGRLNFLFRSIKIPEALNSADFFGLNYYTTEQVRFSLSPANFFSKRTFPPGSAVSPTGFIANHPAGFARAIRWANNYNLPVLITENGVEDAEDGMRPNYLVEHLHQVARLSSLGTPVKGYFHWSLVDNFEWERGWSQRFGLWGLNNENQARLRRPSVDLYTAICKANALSSEIVEKFAPAAFDKIFPV